MKREWPFQLLLLVSILIAALMLFRSPGDFSVHPEEVVRLYPGPEDQASALEVSGRVLAPSDEDPQIVFSLSPSRIKSVTVLFDSPLQQDAPIQVFYASEGEAFSESNSTSAVARRSSTEWTLNLPGGEYAQIRLDLSAQIQVKEILANRSYVGVYAKWIYAAILAALLVGIAFYNASSRKSETLYLVFSLSLGLLYLLSLTPLSVSDEPHHYQSAYELSNVLLFQGDRRGEGSSAAFDYTDFTRHHNTSAGYSRIARTVTAPAEEGQTVEIPTPRDISYFPMYLPQALGISFARLIHANFIWTFWLGRLFNLLFYVLCTYWAIRSVPRYKTLFFLVALAPKSLHQAASFSYDAFVNALSLLLLALLLKAMLEEKLWDKRAIGAALAVSMLLSPAKVAYYPLSALALLIPKTRFKSKKARVLCLCALILLPLLFLLLFRFQIMAYKATDTGAYLNWEGQRDYTIAFIFRHPITTLGIFKNTVLYEAVGWMLDMVGYSLSALTLDLPLWIPGGYFLLLLLSAIRKEQDPACLSVRDRCAFLLVAFTVVVSVMLIMFVGWTSDTRTLIAGIQGRYFIPILPLLLLSLNGDILVLRRNFDKEMMMTAELVNIAAVSTVVQFTFMN